MTKKGVQQTKNAEKERNKYESTRTYFLIIYLKCIFIDKTAFVIAKMMFSIAKHKAS